MANYYSRSESGLSEPLEIDRVELEQLMQDVEGIEKLVN